jgi:hypothetical protein
MRQMVRNETKSDDGKWVPEEKKYQEDEEIRRIIIVPVCMALHTCRGDVMVLCLVGTRNVALTPYLPVAQCAWSHGLILVIDLMQ